MFSLFLFGDIFAVRMRYTRFARAIYCRFASMRYDINPLTPRRAYRLCGKYRVLNICGEVFKTYRKFRKGFISRRVFR